MKEKEKKREGREERIKGKKEASNEWKEGKINIKSITKGWMIK